MSRPEGLGMSVKWDAAQIQQAEGESYAGYGTQAKGGWEVSHGTNSESFRKHGPPHCWSWQHSGALTLVHFFTFCWLRSDSSIEPL